MDKGQDSCHRGVFNVLFNKYISSSVAMMVHRKVVKVVVESRVLDKPIIMISHKVQSIFLHVDFIKMWLL